ncbi:MAG TPA: tRNA-dihydrouridine synthase, partial [Gemmatimonadales bacterium]|nr:tRNA-dihydrouridine synthase [Gemmatimonadales bacterium]
CAGVMIGRGSFGNPWLFRDARALLDGQSRPAAPDAAERFAVALEHAHLAVELQGDTRTTVMEFRKHFGWYTRGLHGATTLRAALFQVETMAAAEEIFARYLDATPMATI